MDARPDPGPRARLFLALDLPERVRRGLAAWGERELRDPALRALAPASLHVTLCFLGWRPEAAIPRIAAQLAAIRPRRVRMRFAPEPAAKPPRRPRFFALELDSPAARELQAELEGALAGAGLHEPERREYWPHLTVAKVRPQRGRPRRAQRVARGAGPLPPDLLEPFGAVRVALYRSKLRPTGAQYVSLANLDLPSAA